jgi:hypothetical protein
MIQELWIEEGMERRFLHLADCVQIKTSNSISLFWAHTLDRVIKEEMIHVHYQTG